MPRIAPDSVRYGALALAAAALTVAIAMWAGDRQHIAFVQTAASQRVTPVNSDTVQARSAAVMAAQEPLNALLTNQDAVRNENARYLAALDQRYRAEPVDARDAAVAEKALIAVSEDPALTAIGPKIWSAHCRSRNCKIDAAFNDYDDAQEWANFFLTGSAGILAQAELSVRLGGDGTTRVLIFGVRQ